MQTQQPEQVGMSTERLNRIRPVMQKYVEQKRCAGILTLIARRGQIVHCDCVGLRAAEAEKPMTPDSIFRIYSMTKPITNAAALMLYEEGKFRLTDPVAQYIPAFRDTKVWMRNPGMVIKLADQQQEMQIWHLMTHTSGLTYGFDGNSPVDQQYQAILKQHKYFKGPYLINPNAKPLAKMAPELAKLPLVHQPGTDWQYGFSTDVLGYLIEVVSGMSLDQFLHQRIFAPLQMHDTGFSVPSDKIERFAAMYESLPTGDFRLVDDPTTSPYAQTQHFLSGGGGLVSTASDYWRFAQMLLNRGEFEGVRLLSRKTIELMTMNHLPDNILNTTFAARYPGYGCGFGVRMVLNVAPSRLPGSVGNFGWSGVARTDFWVDPREELIGVIMLQLIGGKPIPFKEDFRILTYQAITD